jgi:hypothetical protein
MGFGSSMAAPSANNENTQSTESIYLKLPTDKPNEVTIRILDTEEYVYWRYYMQVNVGGQKQWRSIVVGPGDTPIKRHFDKFDKNDPQRARPGKRMLLNVLDRSVTEANEPKNKVYIMDFGADIMSKLMPYHRRVRHQQTFTPLNIWEFDVVIISTPGKEAKDVQRAVVPGMDQDPLPKELTDTLLKYDLSQVVHVMPNEAQERLLKDGDLLEILKELNWPRPQATLKLQ